MLETSGRNKLSDLAQIIIGEGYKRVMVFCDTKFNTAALANQLARLGSFGSAISCCRISGGFS